MTVKDLKQKLEGIPDDMDVMIMQVNDEYQYSMGEEAGVSSITFQDPDIPEDEWCDVDCFVITD